MKKIIRPRNVFLARALGVGRVGGPIRMIFKRTEAALAIGAETENCCRATRARTILGVIIWSVYLKAKASAQYGRRNVHVAMSNRGEIFHDLSHKDVGD